MIALDAFRNSPLVDESRSLPREHRPLGQRQPRIPTTLYRAAAQAERAGIATPHHQLLNVAGKAVLLSRRFDRSDRTRIPLLSAMSMAGSVDGERGSYPELVDALARHGTHAKADAEALYRRMVFNVLVSNVDDHLRNHGFLWLGRNGWSLSPAYDLNPTPTDMKARILSTNINLDEGTCSIALVESAAKYFGLTLTAARNVIREVGARPPEIIRLASAFEHDDLARARAL
jgi:serine/threonine-protein kinase HipA